MKRVIYFLTLFCSLGAFGGIVQHEDASLQEDLNFGWEQESSEKPDRDVASQEEDTESSERDIASDTEDNGVQFWKYQED